MRALTLGMFSFSPLFSIFFFQQNWVRDAHQRHQNRETVFMATQITAAPTLPFQGITIVVLLALEDTQAPTNTSPAKCLFCVK